MEVESDSAFIAPNPLVSSQPSLQPRKIFSEAMARASSISENTKFIAADGDGGENLEGPPGWTTWVGAHDDIMHCNFYLVRDCGCSLRIMEVVDIVVQPLKEFAKYSIRLIKRCHKPDRKEFSKVSFKTTIGFVVMGFVGFFVKLIFIPINNLIGAFRNRSLRGITTKWRHAFGGFSYPCTQLLFGQGSSSIS
ncbi:hypothetical protein SUGI_0813210 [Cryptomeria japonica]|nr:hypothetical protein SUGI_0813210 [Cryptomeria japonica]